MGSWSPRLFLIGFQEVAAVWLPNISFLLDLAREHHSGEHEFADCRRLQGYRCAGLRGCGAALEPRRLVGRSARGQGALYSRLRDGAPGGFSGSGTLSPHAGVPRGRFQDPEYWDRSQIRYRQHFAYRISNNL